MCKEPRDRAASAGLDPAPLSLERGPGPGRGPLSIEREQDRRSATFPVKRHTALLRPSTTSGSFYQPSSDQAGPARSAGDRPAPRVGTKLAPRPPGRSCSRPRILGGQGRCATRRCRPSGRSPAVRPTSRRMCERAGRAGRRHAGGMIPAALRGCYSQRNAAQAVIAAASAIARLTANGAWSRARVPGGGTLSAMNDFDVAVIGGGAARLSAVLVLAWARHRVAVVEVGAQRNAPAAHMHGFLSPRPNAAARSAGRRSGTR